MDELKQRIEDLESRHEIQAAAKEQKHLDELDDGAWSEARVYWHYGYLVALRDAMKLMGKK